MPTDESEAYLVARAVQRDSEAFSALYNLYFDRIYRYARLKLGNQMEAEDVTGIVFLNAWNSVHRFVPLRESSFASWLFRLARNAVIDRRRRQRNDVSLGDDDTTGPLIAAVANPATELEWRLTIDELNRALRTLTEEQREVVLLRFVEGLSAREVGVILGKQEGTVRGMQHRAIEALRRALDATKGGRRHD